MLRLNQLSLSYGERVLFDEVTVQVNPHDRIGVVGDNGAGKSTLLRIIAGVDTGDGGIIERAKYVTVGYLPQEGVVHHGATLFAEVETAFDNVLSIRTRLEEANARLQELPDSETAARDEVLSLIGELEHRLQDLDATRLNAKIAAVLAGLGFSAADHDRACHEFSGGWQMRIALAKLLLREPAVLLMDEPTNHLDLDSLRWLEQYLRTYDGALVLVSHDRAFLDALCGRIFHIVHGRIDTYRGNYSAFEVERKQRRELQLRAAENQRREREHLQEFVDRFRYKASKAAQAQSRLKRLAKMELIEIEEEDATIGFRFPPPPRSGQVVLRLAGLTKRYGGKPVLHDLELEIQRGDRIAVVGVNGAGKSTLSRVIAGAETFQAGTRELGHNVKLSYFAQNQADELDPQASVLDLAAEHAHSDLRANVRTILGAFLFRGDDVFKQAKVLSGGEKNRLALARMLLQPANFLVLDEPTNHLDMRSKEVLQRALLEYQGTFLIVSHDRAFLDPLVNRVLEVRPEGVRSFPGNISDYLHKLALESAATSNGSWRFAAEPSETNDTAVAELDPRRRRQRDAERRQRAAKWKKEAEALENRIADLEQQIASFEAAMAAPEFYRDGNEAAAKLQAYAAAKRDLEAALHDWEHATQMVEQIVSGKDD